MRNLFSFLLLALATTSFAQDEFPDNRKKMENFSKMQEKDIRNDLASFAFAGVDESMGKQRLPELPVMAYGSNYMTFGKGDTTVTIRAGFFDPSRHKLQYYDNKYLIKIDGKPFYGNYGDVPHTTIASITVLMGKDTVKIPEAALADLYEPAFTYAEGANTRTHNGVYISHDKHHVYIYMLNRELSGHYEVTWVIEDKKYLRRVVDGGVLK